MTIHKQNTVSRAFSLVEMLVVVAIIAILISILVPSFGAIRQRARQAATTAQFGALDSGIAAYRAEQPLGGGLPPSASDMPQATNNKADRIRIADPRSDSPGKNIKIAGAHLLVYAMIGADGLGTPGFRDISRNGTWSDDTHRAPPNQSTPAGLYHVDTSGKEAHQRYGGGGYVDEKMRERIRSLSELYEEGKIVTDPSSIDQEIGKDESMFLDMWDHPILYYKANPSALWMVADGNASKPGIYWQEDNAIITGSDGGVVQGLNGIDFGAGTDEDHTNQYHLIHDAKAADPTSDKVVDVAETSGNQFEHTFARYIIDPSIKARPTPVQKNEYLLISAGPDAIYGSQDDVTNFTRKTE